MAGLGAMACTAASAAGAPACAPPASASALIERSWLEHARLGEPACELVTMDAIDAAIAKLEVEDAEYSLSKTVLRFAKLTKLHLMAAAVVGTEAGRAEHEKLALEAARRALGFELKLAKPDAGFDVAHQISEGITFGHFVDGTGEALTKWLLSLDSDAPVGGLLTETFVPEGLMATAQRWESILEGVAAAENSGQPKRADLLFGRFRAELERAEAAGGRQASLSAQFAFRLTRGDWTLAPGLRPVAGRWLAIHGGQEKEQLLAAKLLIKSGDTMPLTFTLIPEAGIGLAHQHNDPELLGMVRGYVAAYDRGVPFAMYHAFAFRVSFYNALRLDPVEAGRIASRFITQAKAAIEQDPKAQTLYFDKLRDLQAEPSPAAAELKAFVSGLQPAP
jgi:hypothetical protein